MLGIDEREKAVAARGPLSRIDLEFKNGKLDTLAVIETGAGQTSQASLTAWRGGFDIVGDKHVHREAALILNPRVFVDAFAGKESRQDRSTTASAGYEFEERFFVTSCGA